MDVNDFADVSIQLISLASRGGILIPAKYFL